MNDIAGAETRTKHKTRIGELSFDFGMPTGETVAKLYDEMDFQRAVQAYLWAAPTVGMEESKQTIELNSGAGNGDIVICEGYRNLSEFLTPNLTTTYIMALLNLAEQGPMVVEYPAGATAGVVDDWWDRPVTDLGQPGPDRGQGCKYLFVGPGQEAPAAEGLYFAPKVQPGFEKNWIPTMPGRAWFAYFRLYGPLGAYFDRSWPLPDIEQPSG